MAKRFGSATGATKRDTVRHRTSIGQSKLSRPKNKSKRADFKKYRGQGK
tara:strand:- start:40 stop:186 length:147 start_codon:yes stop_codon:yes gene_type:complete